MIYDSQQCKNLIAEINKIEDSYLRNQVINRLEEFIEYMINKEGD